jgi:ketosteroid isomerase-like protein
MHTLMIALALLLAPAVAAAQTAGDATLLNRLQKLEDTAALRRLVDTFSILADTKDVPKQMLLFTEDAVVESESGGQRGSSFKGRHEIGDAFAAFLKNFDTVYHMNGQHRVDIQGDKATGTYYCLVVLVGRENGKPVRTTMGVYYDDEYIRRGDAWLIAKRESHFAWRSRDEMAATRAR